jgi:desulfoferrodoxin-like iron-binding protein
MANQAGKRLRCPVCGGEVIVIKGGEGTLRCCDRPMEVR